MNVSSSYGLSVPYAPTNSASSVKALEGQVSTLTKQIDQTCKDDKLDCKSKDAQLATLRAQLERAQDQLQELRTKADPVAAPTSASPTGQENVARSAAAKKRGGIDVYA